MTPRRERVYQGPLLAPDGSETRGSIYSNGVLAIVFDAGNVQLDSLPGPVKALDGDGHLTVSGGGRTWTAVAPERELNSWVNVQAVMWPGEEPWKGATVKQSTYRVTVLLAGQEPRVLPGASVLAAGGGLAILDGETLIPVTQKRGCGCGGR